MKTAAEKTPAEKTPDPFLADRLMLAAGYLAGSEMPDCALAVLYAYRLLFGEQDIPANTLAAAIILKLAGDENDTTAGGPNGNKR